MNYEEGTTEPGKAFVTLAQAMSSAPEVATAVREFLTERVWADRPVQGDEAKTARTSALVSSQLLGPPGRATWAGRSRWPSGSRSQVAAWIGPTIEAYITAA